MVRGLNLFSRGTASIGCKRNPMPRALRRAYIAPYDSWAHRIAVHRFVQDIPLRPGDRAYNLVTEVQGRLGGLAEVPMLIGWGMKDFVFDRHFLDEWVRRFPNAEVVRFPEAGHYVLEDEAEALIPRIRAFLDAHPTGPGAVDLREAGARGAPP
jgi:haloalkane dehalogenase